jgi:hypothetical protein
VFQPLGLVGTPTSSITFRGKNDEVWQSKPRGSPTERSRAELQALTWAITSAGSLTSRALTGRRWEGRASRAAPRERRRYAAVALLSDMEAPYAVPRVT